jgi:hypothetical protein
MGGMDVKPIDDELYIFLKNSMYYKLYNKNEVCYGFLCMG